MINYQYIHQIEVAINRSGGFGASGSHLKSIYDYVKAYQSSCTIGGASMKPTTKVDRAVAFLDLFRKIISRKKYVNTYQSSSVDSEDCSSGNSSSDNSVTNSTNACNAAVLTVPFQPSNFNVGTIVRIHSLAGKPEYNGLYGVIHGKGKNPSMEPGEFRYPVTIKVSESGGGSNDLPIGESSKNPEVNPLEVKKSFIASRILSLKPKNLEIVKIEYKAGDSVKIKGLLNKSEYNGLTGIIYTEFEPQSGRYTVKLDNEEKTKSKSSTKSDSDPIILRLKPENLSYQPYKWFLTKDGHCILQECISYSFGIDEKRFKTHEEIIKINRDDGPEGDLVHHIIEGRAFLNWFLSNSSGNQGNKKESEESFMRYQDDDIDFGKDLDEGILRWRKLKTKNKWEQVLKGDEEVDGKDTKEVQEGKNSTADTAAGNGEGQVGEKKSKNKRKRRAAAAAELQLATVKKDKYVKQLSPYYRFIESALKQDQKSENKIQLENLMNEFNRITKQEEKEKNVVKLNDIDDSDFSDEDIEEEYEQLLSTHLTPDGRPSSHHNHMIRMQEPDFQQNLSELMKKASEEGLEMNPDKIGDEEMIKNMEYLMKKYPEFDPSKSMNHGPNGPDLSNYKLPPGSTNKPTVTDDMEWDDKSLFPKLKNTKLINREAGEEIKTEGNSSTVTGESESDHRCMRLFGTAEEFHGLWIPVVKLPDVGSTMFEGGMRAEEDLGIDTRGLLTTFVEENEEKIMELIKLLLVQTDRNGNVIIDPEDEEEDSESVIKYWKNCTAEDVGKFMEKSNKELKEIEKGENSTSKIPTPNRNRNSSSIKITSNMAAAKIILRMRKLLSSLITEGVTYPMVARGGTRISPFLDPLSPLLNVVYRTKAEHFIPKPDSSFAGPLKGKFWGWGLPGYRGKQYGCLDIFGEKQIKERKRRMDLRDRIKLVGESEFRLWLENSEDGDSGEHSTVIDKILKSPEELWIGVLMEKKIKQMKKLKKKDLKIKEVLGLGLEKKCEKISGKECEKETSEKSSILGSVISGVLGKFGTKSDSTVNSRSQPNNRPGNGIPKDLILKVHLPPYATSCLVGENPETCKDYPIVYRRIRVSAGISIADFEELVLKPAVGWSPNYHSGIFFDQTDGSCFGTRKSDSVDHYHLITTFSDVIEASEYELGILLKEVGDKLIYLYDLGESYLHEVEVEEVVDSSIVEIDSDESNEGLNDNLRATVLDGAYRCPPEDGNGLSRVVTDSYGNYNRPDESDSDLDSRGNLGYAKLIMHLPPEHVWNLSSSSISNNSNQNSNSTNKTTGAVTSTFSWHQPSLKQMQEHLDSLPSDFDTGCMQFGPKTAKMMQAQLHEAQASQNYKDSARPYENCNFDAGIFGSLINSNSSTDKTEENGVWDRFNNERGKCTSGRGVFRTIRSQESVTVDFDFEKETKVDMESGSSFNNNKASKMHQKIMQLQYLGGTCCHFFNPYDFSAKLADIHVQRQLQRAKQERLRHNDNHSIKSKIKECRKNHTCCMSLDDDDGSRRACSFGGISLTGKTLKISFFGTSSELDHEVFKQFGIKKLLGCGDGTMLYSRIAMSLVGMQQDKNWLDRDLEFYKKTRPGDSDEQYFDYHPDNTKEIEKKEKEAFTNLGKDKKLRIPGVKMKCDAPTIPSSFEKKLHLKAGESEYLCKLGQEFTGMSNIDPENLSIVPPDIVATTQYKYLTAVAALEDKNNLTDSASLVAAFRSKIPNSYPTQEELEKLKKVNIRELRKQFNDAGLDASIVIGRMQPDGTLHEDTDNTTIKSNCTNNSKKDSISKKKMNIVTDSSQSATELDNNVDSDSEEVVINGLGPNRGTKEFLPPLVSLGSMHHTGLRWGGGTVNRDHRKNSMRGGYRYNHINHNVKYTRGLLANRGLLTKVLLNVHYTLVYANYEDDILILDLNWSYSNHRVICC